MALTDVVVVATTRLSFLFFMGLGSVYFGLKSILLDVGVTICLRRVWEVDFIQVVRTVYLWRGRS
jgi:hypothetical protein